MAAPHVLLVGRATRDEEILFAEPWQAGDNVTVSDSCTRFGGLVSWAAGALVKEGVTVTQWGSTGVDIPVDYLDGAYDHMSREGYAHLIRVCVEPGGQRTFLSGSGESFPPLKPLPLPFDAPFDAVVIDGYMLLAERNAPCLVEMLPDLISDDAPVVVALPVPRKLADEAPDFLQVLREVRASVVVGGVDEQRLLPGVQPWYRVTTTGNRPWVSLDFPDDGGRLKVMTPLVEACSTNGAGDVFAGVLAAALADREWFWPGAIRAAHAAASSHVESR